MRQSFRLSGRQSICERFRTTDGHPAFRAHDDDAGGDSGLLPAALSHEIGSDSQRPFAIVIVGGLIAALGMSVFLLPTLYVWIARDGDVLPEAEAETT